MNGWTMRLARAAGLALLLAALPAGAQSQKALAPKPDAPGMSTNHRLILKDGSYQLARQFSIEGDRVRYLSQERGDWEELPADLVDWEATRKWERDHANPDEGDTSPAMKEAAAIDKEEATERAEQTARMPEVAKGLELPDQDGVFALDTFQGTPELVELKPSDLDMQAKTHHGLSTLNPLAASRANLELDGAHARVHLHVNDPALYLSLDTDDAEETEPVLSHPITIDVSGSREGDGHKYGAHSSASGFAFVRVDERRAVRVVGAIRIGPTGKAMQDQDVIPATVEVLPGKHWLRLQPKQKLLTGEYALVEIVSPTEMNQSVWDFRVDPAMGDNAGSLGPILQTDSRR